MVKGDMHSSISNTVFGTEPVEMSWVHKKDTHNNMIILVSDYQLDANNHSVTNFNAADRISASRSGSNLEEGGAIPGEYSGNFNGYENLEAGSVESMLEDVQGFNFCPKEGSEIDVLGAGAHQRPCENMFVPGADWAREPVSIPNHWKSDPTTTQAT